MDRWYTDSEQHLFGTLDAMLQDIRANVAAPSAPSDEIDTLMRRAEDERAAVETVLRDLAERHATLTATIDELQQKLSVAGVPLRGEIS